MNSVNFCKQACKKITKKKQKKTIIKLATSSILIGKKKKKSLIVFIIMRYRDRVVCPKTFLLNFQISHLMEKF